MSSDGVGMVKIKRKGARTLATVPLSVIEMLEGGAESVNHIEQMAIDMSRLLANIAPEVEAGTYQVNSPHFLDRMRACSALIWNHFGEDLFEVAATWSSDTARGWAAFAVPAASGTLEGQLTLALRYAEDPHFAVREWAWLGVRQLVVAAPQEALDYLTNQATSSSALTRRFCVEATRPRSVWGRHIKLLLSEPERGEPLLNSVATAPERYVRDSVANWVNDAARTRPDWVAATCTRWAQQHDNNVGYVIRRATRSLPTTAKAV